VVDLGLFIGAGTRRFQELAAGMAEVRPWLQAFPYRVSNYDGDYIRIQIDAAMAAGGAGWSLWNPSCRYGVALDVLPDLLNRDPASARRVPVVASRDRRNPSSVAAVPVAEAAVADPSSGSTGLLMGALVSRRPDPTKSP